MQINVKKKKMENKQDVLIYDIETQVYGRPDPKKDKFKLFCCYSYKSGKYYCTKDSSTVQKLIDKHKFLVGFNVDYYDNPILAREGIKFKYKTVIDLMKIIKSRKGSMKTKKGMLGDVLMEHSLDYITRFLDLVDDSSAKGDIDYSVFQKESWTQEEEQEIKVYAKRDVEVTKKLYEWLEKYFDGFKSFIRPEDVEKKAYLTVTMAKFAYKAICKSMKWEEQYGNIDIDEESILGGYVAYPAGEKYKGNIYCLDWNSLYSKIMNQTNLHCRKKGETSDRPIWNGGGKWKVEGVYYSDELGEVGKLLRQWYYDRLEYKKIGDRREYTIKILLNNVYGATDYAAFLRLFDKVASGDCTRLGRQWTIYARKIFRDAGYGIIYTDSVGKNSLIRTNKGMFTIENLFKNGKNLKKEYKDNSWNFLNKKQISKPLENIKVLSLDDNYNVLYDKIKKIIRHKTKKKIYRIWLNCYEYLDVTEDHSLIWFDDEGKLIQRKPQDAKNVIGLPSIPIEYDSVRWKTRNEKNCLNPFLSKQILQLLGFWVGDGSLSKANETDINISAGLDVKEFIEKIINPLKLKYRIHNNKYDISIVNQILYKWMKKNKFVGNAHTKKIPEIIFKLPKKQIEHFLSGFCSADGTCNNQGGIFCGCTNEKLVLQIRELFYRVGIQSTMKRNFEFNTYNGVVGKIPTYNFWLKISNDKEFKENIGFIFYRKNKNITVRNGHRVFVPKEYRNKKSNSKEGLFVKNKVKKYIDLPIRHIQKIEEIKYNSYVYDIETQKTGRFFANDILVHNTDSWYIIDPFNNKEKMLAIKDKLVKDIKATLPFPDETFDAGIDDEIKYMFFFKGDKNTMKSPKDLDFENFMADEDDRINCLKNFLKKNYIYVTKDDRVIVKNLGIRKKSTSKLTRTIFWQYLVPKIVEKGEVKFSKTFLTNLINTLLEKDITLASLRKEVGPFSQYRDTSPTSLPAQISQKYGSGIHFVIPNTRMIGVGKSKSKRYCTIEEFKERNLNISNIDLTNVYKELEYFTKPVVMKNIFDFDERKKE